METRRQILGVVSLSDYLRIKRILDNLGVLTSYTKIDQENIIITGEGLVIYIPEKEKGIINLIPCCNNRLTCYLSIEIDKKVLSFPVSKI